MKEYHDAINKVIEFLTLNVKLAEGEQDYDGAIKWQNFILEALLIKGEMIKSSMKEAGNDIT